MDANCGGDKKKLQTQQNTHTIPRLKVKWHMRFRCVFLLSFNYVLVSSGNLENNVYVLWVCFQQTLQLEFFLCHLFLFLKIVFIGFVSFNQR